MTLSAAERKFIRQEKNHTVKITTLFLTPKSPIIAEPRHTQKLASNVAGGQFTGNKNGLGGNMLLNPAMISSVNKVAHEFFHGYQHDMGSGGASILSEVEAYLFGAAMQERVTGNPIHMFGDMSQAGNIYTNMMLSTLYAHQFVDVNAHFHSAMSTFKQGSYANKLSNGLYSNFPMRAQKQRVLINKFYPLFSILIVNL